MPMYKSKKGFKKSNANILSATSVNLPSGYNLKEKDIRRVYYTIMQFLKLEKIKL